MIYFLFTTRQGSTFHAMGENNSKYVYDKKDIPQDMQHLKHDLEKKAEEVEKKKENYGIGVSTKIIMMNNTDHDLEFFESGSTSGRWDQIWDDANEGYILQAPPETVSFSAP